MNVQERVLISIVVLLALICFGVLLRWLGVFKRDDGEIFARLATEITLPALIFSSLSTSQIQSNELLLALLMAGSVFVCVSVGWLTGRILRLRPEQTGSVILAAGFGSSGLLGYPLIAEAFPHDPAALTEAVVISEIGFAPLLFSLGILIAIRYGAPEIASRDRLRAATQFLRSPIFVSLVAGLLCSAFQSDMQGPLLESVVYIAKIVGSANTLVVTLAIGFLLRFAGLQRLLVLSALVVAVKLFLQPLLLWAASTTLDVETSQGRVLVLQGAMPSALVSVVLAKRYGCDAELASKLVFLTFVVALLTLPVLSMLLF